MSTTKLSIYIHEYVYTIIMVSISPNARDGTSEISRDPNTKSHIVAENDFSKHSRDSLRTHIYLYIRKNFICAFSSPHGNSLVIYTQRYHDTIPISLLCSLVAKCSSKKDVGMVFVCHCCVTTHCLFPFRCFKPSLYISP